MNSWPTFFSAELGASAALTGLVVVAISVNLSRILEIREAPGRAAESLVSLASVLVIASLALFPGQAAALLGVETLITGLVAFAAPVAIQVATLRQASHHIGPAKRIGRSVLSAAVSLPFVAAGALLIAGDAGGLYWVAGSVVLSLVAGLVSTWILLIEIAR